MDYFRRFTFLLCAPAFDPDELEGTRLHQIVVAVEKSGFEVIRARRVEDAELAIKTDAAIGCMIVDWGKKGMEDVYKRQEMAGCNIRMQIFDDAGVDRANNLVFEIGKMRGAGHAGAFVLERGARDRRSPLKRGGEYRCV